MKSSVYSRLQQGLVLRCTPKKDVELKCSEICARYGGNYGTVRLSSRFEMLLCIFLCHLPIQGPVTDVARSAASCHGRSIFYTEAMRGCLLHLHASLEHAYLYYWEIVTWL